MRWLHAAIAASLLCLCVAGCGGDKEKANDKPPGPGSAKTPDAAVAAGDRTADAGAGAAPGSGAAPSVTPDAGAAATPATPAAPVVPGTVHLAVIFTEELLKSEVRSLGAIQKSIERAAKGRTVTRADASAGDEKAFVAAHLAATPAATAPTWPAAWAGKETVIVLEVLPSTGVKPERRTGGLGSILVFRAPRAAPIYVERIAGEKEGYPLGGEDVPPWLAGIFTQLLPAAKGTP